MYTGSAYKDEGQVEFRFRIKAENGQIVAGSEESFVKRQHALDMLDKILKVSVMQDIRNTLMEARTSNLKKMAIYELIDDAVKIIDLNRNVILDEEADNNGRE